MNKRIDTLKRRAVGEPHQLRSIGLDLSPWARGFFRCLLAACLLLFALLPTGCGSSDDDSALVARTPKEAASQLEQAFADADRQLQENASAASDALRTGDYEKAIVSLETVRAAPSVTLQQGLAIHSSMVSMEQSLIQAMEAGDERARRAYELLKRAKRN